MLDCFWSQRVSLAQPDKHSDRPSVNAVDHWDLVILLLDACLVDAEGTDPGSFDWVANETHLAALGVERGVHLKISSPTSWPNVGWSYL